MSHRPLRKKKANKLRKAMRRELPRFFDPVQWLVDRGYAPTKRAAREIIFAARLRAGSHPVGFEEVEVFNVKIKGMEKRKIVVGVPVSAKSELLVLGA